MGAKRTIDYSDFTVVMPTINEQDNIKLILGLLLRSYKGISIIVADDGSTDNTERYVRNIARAHGRVMFLDRHSLGRERGLTASVVDGIERARTKFAIVMDADMQHPYESVADIAGMLSSGNKLAVAVRIRTKNWSLHRRLISRLLLNAGYLVLVLRNRQSCNDVSSGFFGVDRNFFIKTYKENKRRYVMDGIRVLFDTLKCVRRGSVPMAEVPYTLLIRTRNVSKVGFGHGIKAIRSFVT